MFDIQKSSKSLTADTLALQGRAAFFGANLKLVGWKHLAEQAEARDPTSLTVNACLCRLAIDLDDGLYNTPPIFVEVHLHEISLSNSSI